MSEFELIQLSQASSAQQALLFGQIIAINFAMILAIYYFLHGAAPTLKVASFFLYSLGMFVFLGYLIFESNSILSYRNALRQLPSDDLSAAGRWAISTWDHWISIAFSIAANLSIISLWVGVAYLLFFWKRGAARI